VETSHNAPFEVVSLHDAKAIGLDSGLGATTALDTLTSAALLGCDLTGGS